MLTSKGIGQLDSIPLATLLIEGGHLCENVASPAQKKENRQY